MCRTEMEGLQMIILNVTYQMKQGISPADFVNALEESGLAPFCRQEKGNHSYRYFYPADGESQVLLLEKWDDEAALNVHMETENFAAISQVTERYAEDMELNKVDTGA